MLHSSIVKGGVVPFPAFIGERAYMIPFKQDKLLPKAWSRWNDTVEAMLAGIKSTKDCYFMVDQRFVKAGTTHRRAGLHVDGYWLGDGHGHRISTHGFDRGGHRTTPPPGHHPVPRHSHGNTGIDELLILASDEYGCDAYMGDWDESLIGTGGSVNNCDLSTLSRVPLDNGRAWIGDVFTLHSSVPHVNDVCRTVVRLNVPLGD